MASMTISSNFSLVSNQPLKTAVLRSVPDLIHMNQNIESIKISSAFYARQGFFRRMLLSPGSHSRCLLWPPSAVGSASTTDSKLKDINLTNVKVVVESQDDDKIHVRVELTGEQTQRVFDEVLTNLAAAAPPVPGFRRKKGGKTSNVPKNILLQMIGHSRVTKFVIQEILSLSMADYVKQEDLKVKSEFNTTQTSEELESAFAPGSEFGFNVTMEFEKSEAESESEESETETNVTSSTEE